MVESIRRAAISWTALALLGIGLVAPVGAEPSNDNRAPDLGDFDKLQAPEGNVVSFHAYAEGVQIWRWNGTSWVFVKPEALLYAAGEDGGIVGIHYEGPTWESFSGSYVVGTVVDRATPNADSIPWLLLKKVESEGPGIFDRVTYIQRVNTVGGIAPADPGEALGEEVRIPYSADYYFYRKHE
jgi:Protein of unknown function (DUF3455)